MCIFKCGYLWVLLNIGLSTEAEFEIAKQFHYVLLSQLSVVHDIHLIFLSKHCILAHIHQTLIPNDFSSQINNCVLVLVKMGHLKKNYIMNIATINLNILLYKVIHAKFVK